MLSDDADDVVFGELYRLRQPEAELLREFDMYEACGEGFAEPTEYIRQMLPVTLDDGAASEAWTYVYNWPVAHLPRIASGRFHGGVGEADIRMPPSFRMRLGAGPESIIPAADMDSGLVLRTHRNDEPL